MDPNLDAHTPQIRTHPNRDGVQIVDPIQEIRFSLFTQEPVDPGDCDTDRFYFPADTAATLRTDTIETPYLVASWIRDEDGEPVAEVKDEESTTVPPGRYNIELSTTRVKIQFAVDGRVTVETFDDKVRYTVSETDEIHVGVRSLHEQPATTVTTTDNPEDVMAAISTFGSALKTTSCERSFQTLRGHPPLIERGTELSIPDEIDDPATGITIEVPPELEYIYPVTPLAYYLGADVESGPVPRIVTDDWDYSLVGRGEFEERVARTFKQIFLLDCVTRTEGYYQVELHERDIVEDVVDFDFETLYGRPIAEQVETYLDVPYEALSDAIPKWKLTTDVQPEVENLGTLPFIANDLAIVRCPHPETATAESPRELSDEVESFFREQPNALTRSTKSRSTRATQSLASKNGEIVRPDDADSIEQAYVGDGIPIGASKMTVDAYRRRLEFEPSDDPQIRVVVVCNDEQMTDENVVSDIYGTRDWVEFDIEFVERLSTSELRDVLRADVDFLHYIGHVDDEGIRCPDGYLDTRQLTEVNTVSFVLNACDSYEQGRGLIEAGAMAGVATVADVVNEAATSVGRTVAKLLNVGFSLGAAVRIIREYEQIGHHYHAIGDGTTPIVENKSGTPVRLLVEARDDGEFELSLYGYPNLITQMGSIFTPQIEGDDEFYLNSGLMGENILTEKELLDYLHSQDSPVELEDSLVWSGEVSDV